MKPLSREFLLKRGFCCNNGCINCPYMKSLKTKEDLIKTVLEQIVMDVHCGDSEAIEELLTFCPIENLIGYLPESDWKKFKHLELEEVREIRTENALINLIKVLEKQKIRELMNLYPDDAEFGKKVREYFTRFK